MKIFNKEISNCHSCNNCYNYNFNSWQCKLTKQEINEPLEIKKDCPFLKNNQKSDFESFGFLFDPELNKYKKKTEDNTYYLKFHNDILCDITRLQKGEGYIETLFSGTITSKPHLQFILDSVGISCS